MRERQAQAVECSSSLGGAGTESAPGAIEHEPFQSRRGRRFVRHGETFCRLASSFRNASRTSRMRE